MLLELVNALAATFLLTEPPESARERLGWLCAVGLFNFLCSDCLDTAVLAPGSVVAALQAAARGSVAAAVHRIEWVAAQLGSSAVMALAVGLVALSLALHRSEKRRAEAGTADRRWYLLAVGLGLGTFLALTAVGVDERVHHQEPLKVLTLLIVFGGVCLTDVRRYRPEISTAQFAANGWAAVALVLPVCPCLSVLLSVGFLVLVTVFEGLRLNTKILNTPIYWGTLYGPFAFVYYETKRISLRGSALPT